MPRYRRDLASQKLDGNAKFRTPEELESGYEFSNGKGERVQSSGLAGQREFEASNPERYQEPMLTRAQKAFAKTTASLASKQFKDYISGNDIREAHEAEKENFLPLDFEPGLTQAIAQVSKQRKAETVEQAKIFGSGPAWEDIHPERQQHILNKLAAHGITAESAHRAFSTQLSQAIQTGFGKETAPYASNFYHEFGQKGGVPTPRQQIHNTAQEFGVPFHIAAVAHAMTSPQLPFETKSGESTTLHNDDAARQTLTWAMNNVDVDNIESKHLEHLHRSARNTKKMKNTVHVLKQLIQGVPLNEVKGMPGKDTPDGDEPFGDKTGAYLHAWLNPESKDARQVIDTHTIMGFAPHLNKRNGEHETVNKINGAHAFFDHIGKQVMEAHGLKNVHWTQAAQWGQQRIDSSQISEKNAYAKYTDRDTVSRPKLTPYPGYEPPEPPEQGTLF